ncbi:hypothetical protein ANN_01417 [Periplaneta americana]|uniref:Reverse transcriptase domain-containing protein n=1 Tax=Periplaneta americana TaxID=6978 RepID=A0ABQ8TTJ2_PERAM|nr:hypothetical protein ANN_01417 [Periplaneta americana]
MGLQGKQGEQKETEGNTRRAREYKEDEGNERKTNRRKITEFSRTMQLTLFGVTRKALAWQGGITHRLRSWRSPPFLVTRLVLHDNREGLKLNGLHQLVVYADDLNMLGENPQTIRENTGILLEETKEIGLDEVTEEWKKLHNTELHALYSSPDIIRNIKSRRLRRAGDVAHMGESRNAYRVLVGRPEGKEPSGRPRRRWEVNIKIDLREVGYDGRDWINLPQDRD